MDAKPRLVLLSEDELASDPHPEQPFRMTLDGWWKGSPEDGFSSTRLCMRLDSADLTALLAQGRASQLAHATRIRRTGVDPQSRDELVRQAHIALRRKPPPDVELLRRLLSALEAL